MVQIKILDRSSMISTLKKQLTVDRSETAIVAIDMHRGHLDPSIATMPASPEDCERVIRTMAELFPSFGLVGSVVGLIGMLSGIGDSRVIMSTVPIAITSTLYGVVLSICLLQPSGLMFRAPCGLIFLVIL